MLESSAAQSRQLRVKRWAAIVMDDTPAGPQNFGTVAGDDAIPSGLRRRMGALERLAVRCTLGVLGDPVETDELIFCSRYGNVETLRLLLTSIAAREPMSPMAFSGSVHNAVPGLVGQICKTRLRHTAVAAGRQTFMAGLLEGFALLSSGERKDVTVTFADVALPEVYRGFDDDRLPGIALAMRLELSDDFQRRASVVGPDRTGAAALVAELSAGASAITLDTSDVEGRTVDARP